MIHRTGRHHAAMVQPDAVRAHLRQGIEIVAHHHHQMRLGHHFHHALSRLDLKGHIADAEHFVGLLDDDAHLVVVLAAGKSGAVRGGADLDEKDRRLR